VHAAVIVSAGIDPRDGRREIYSVTVDRGVDASGNPIPLPIGTGTAIECATIVTSG